MRDNPTNDTNYETNTSSRQQQDHGTHVRGILRRNVAEKRQRLELP